MNHLANLATMPDIAWSSSVPTAAQLLRTLAPALRSRLVAAALAAAERLGTTVTRGEEKVWDSLVAAMAMSRRKAIKLTGKFLSALGLGPSLPPLVKPDVHAILALQPGDISHLMFHFLDLPEDWVTNNQALINEATVDAQAATKLLEIIRSLPLQQSITRVCHAVQTGDLSALHYQDFGAANLLENILSNSPITNWGSDVRAVIDKSFLPKTGLSQTEQAHLRAVRQCCETLCRAEDLRYLAEKARSKNTGLSPYHLYLLSTRGGPREHYEETKLGEPPGPERGD